MVSFRFHLVSLIGIFLALGIGIAVGATVVDQATVDYLERQVQEVGDRAQRTNAENDRLNQELGTWQKFADEAGDELVEGRLRNVDTVVVAVQGVDRGPVEQLRQSIVAAGGRLHGTVWFTSKLRLDQPAAVSTLSELLVVAPGPADLVRRSLVDRLATQWATGVTTPLRELEQEGFVELEVAAGTNVDIANLPATARFVVVSGAGAEVANDQLAVPLASSLARQAPLRVLAAEGETPATGTTPAARAVFVGVLRADAEVAARLSTIDNLESFRGRIAAVFALADLGAEGKVGHFGLGPRASRLVPEPAS
ncbi:MAG: copper transporter [Actinobacteria bacterium]|nr:copper transporter [Actinomycetota bacterium]